MQTCCRCAPPNKGWHTFPPLLLEHWNVCLTLMANAASPANTMASDASPTATGSPACAAISDAACWSRGFCCKRRDMDWKILMKREGHKGSDRGVCVCVKEGDAAFCLQLEASYLQWSFFTYNWQFLLCCLQLELFFTYNFSFFRAEKNHGSHRCDRIRRDFLHWIFRYFLQILGGSSY